MLKKEIVDFIQKDSIRREDLLISPYGCKNSHAIRLRSEEQDDVRNPFFQDTDRILHSPIYARYIDKTQVFSEIKNDHVTHRVLHVQLVAKVARVLGRALSLNEDLIEAIALGHDLGHVPFGHEGERILDKICQEEGLGCFVHNAQSVRAVMDLERSGQGLNLCLQTLDGILCHNGELFSQEYRPKKDKDSHEFLADVQGCFEVEKYGKKLIPMTLEGCLVRLCDIVAYIGRDVEDAIEIGLIKREDLPAMVQESLGNNNSDIMDTLVSDILNNSYGKDYLEFSTSVYEGLTCLRDFNYKNIYGHPRNKEDIPRVEYIFRYLYKQLLEELNETGSYIHKWAFNKTSAQYQKKTSSGRMVIDYLSGMTDRFFMEQFENRVMPRGMGYKV